MNSTGSVVSLSALCFESSLLHEADRDHLLGVFPIDGFPARRAVSLAAIVVFLRSHQGAR